MKIEKLFLRALLNALLILVLVGCQSKDSSSEDEINSYATTYNLSSDALEKAKTTFCVHEVTSVTPKNGACNKYRVGDKICINCPNGDCPTTTRFYADDGFWLRACIIETRVVDSNCKDIWPKGTCDSYVTLSKSKI